MSFKIKSTKAKEESIYKSIYLKKHLADDIDKLATQHETSFNNIVVSMIESCLNDIKELENQEDK